jgi:large repetitive protein
MLGMTIFRRALFVLLLVSSVSAFGQADQEIVSAADSPDPVTPGSALTYTVTVRNNGPNPAVNGGVNINLPGAVTRTGESVPAGWTCVWGFGSTCSTPSFAAGATAVITINTTVNASLASFADQSISATFTTSGPTPDPVGGNNSATVTTQVDSPQVDLSVSATDTPDPVFPDGNVTYDVAVTNGGPNTASSVNLNVVPNSSLRFVSANVPSGWSCTLPSVGAVNATFTCSRATWAPGTDNFVVVFSANDEQFGINDTTFQTNFSIGAGASHETDHPDNTTTLTTTYTAPDANVSVAVADSPDPVFPDGNITYTVTVANAGPDTAPNITLSSFGSNNLRFQSASVPAGWNCALPSPNAQTAGFSCTLPGGMVSGGSNVLTFVLQATDELIGINDTTIQFGFTANSTIADPVPGNNTETESTAYVTPDADLSITATDSPDPVGPDGDITYTVTLANAGPDSAAATLNVPMNNTLKFTSIAVPAGFNCTGEPAPGGSASFPCTNPAFASGASAVFTIVLNADADAFGNLDQTIVQNLNVTGSVVDPDNTDNSVNVTTQYDVANANLGVSASDAPDPVAAGSNITYFTVVSNAGPDAATNVTLTIPLHPSLLFVSYAPPAGFACTTPAVGANGTITCTIASLPNPASLGSSLVVQVNPSANNGPDGVIQQGFLISAATNDPVPANNSITVDTQFTTPDANLVVTNSDSPDPVSSGANITYTQTLLNNGPDIAVNATFVQSTPIGTTFQSMAAPLGWSCATPAPGATGVVSCSKASMLPTELATFTFVANVAAGSGSIGSTVTGDSDTFDPDPSNNTASTATNVGSPTSADLAIATTTDATTAPAGSTITYTIVVTNHGPSAATNVVMTDALPASLLFRSITPPAGFTCTTPAFRASGTITCNAATLANGAGATFTLVAEVAPGTTGTITNGATVASDTTDSNGGNSTSTTAPVAILPSSADLTITKNTPTTSIVVGSNVTYTITVGNAGPSTATSVVVNDTLPAGLDFVSATPSQGTCNSASPVVCNLGTILAGANATVTLVARANGTQASVSNTATATSPDATGPDTVTTPAIPVTTGEQQAVAAIPTLSEWMLIVMAGMLGIVAIVKARAL